MYLLTDSLTRLSDLCWRLLLDSAIKGMVLLLLAAMIARFLSRDSAATRHQVWLVAMITLLVLPVLSMLLPQWSVLPQWVAFSKPYAEQQRLDWNANRIQSDGFDAPLPTVDRSDGRSGEGNLAALPGQEVVLPQVATPVTVGTVKSETHTEYSFENGMTVAVGVWLAGFGLFVSRLLLARIWLARVERTARDLSHAAPEQTQPSEQRILDALENVRVSLDIHGSIRVLLHPDKTIPIVWGVSRPRLLIPESALFWSAAQLKSVLLHEMAHIKRRDNLGQLLSQIACTVHWFNPLAWHANWKLHVERERACDDLVLASGIRASAYAEHLLNVTTSRSNPKWTQACGLAMARKSSLHERLAAVLHEKENRRGVTSTVIGASIVMGMGFTIPFSMIPFTMFSVGNDPVLESPVAMTQDPPADEVTQPATIPATETGLLASNFEEWLDWGEPVNGLRGAIMIQTSLQRPEIANQKKIYLVLQNISDKEIRFSDALMKQNEDLQVRVDKRTLYLRDTDLGILSGFVGSRGTGTDVLLQSREIVLLDMLDGEPMQDKSRSVSNEMVDVIMHDPSLSYSANLNLTTAPPGCWSGNLSTPASRGAFAAMGPIPKVGEGVQLFKICLDHARLNGDIPRGMLQLLSEKVQYFIELNSDDASGEPYAQKMRVIVARFTKEGDWSQADVVKLFDDIADVTTIPLRTTLDSLREQTLQRGQVLPKSMQDANWGETLPGGLRMAWMLQPVEQRYHLDSVLKSRVVIHNAGNEPIAFVTRSFHQPEHSATSSDGAPIPMASTYWTTIGRPESYRLHPGEFCEVYAPGIGVGRPATIDDWANNRPGTWILADVGQQVSFQPGEVWLTGDHNRSVDPDWWLKFITDRLNREAPVPANEADRKLILFRAVENLFGTSPTTEEAEAFYADKSPAALSHLASVLAQRSWMKPVTGSIKSGAIQFQVLAVDSEAANRPRVISEPGRYNINDEMQLVISRQRKGPNIINDADLMWYPKGKDAVLTPVALSEGYNAWAAGWLPGTSVIWVLSRDSLKSYDISSPAEVKTITFAIGQVSNASLPNGLLELLTAAISKGENPRVKSGSPASEAGNVVSE